MVLCYYFVYFIGELKMKANTVYQKISTASIAIITVMAFVLSIGFLIFLGKEANKENVESFSNYLKANQVTLYWDQKDDKLLIKKNNVELNQIKDFKWIDHIEYNKSKQSNTQYLVIAYNENYYKNKINNLLFGSPLKDEFSEIKVIINNIDDIELTTSTYLKDIYTQYYPYTVNICDTNSSLYLKVNPMLCDTATHLNLTVNTVKRNFEIKINYYKEWDGIVNHFMTFSKTPLENKLKTYKEASTQIESKYLTQLDKLNINGIYPPHTIIVKDKKMKTVLNLETELMIIRDLKQDYIEKNVKKTAVYTAFKNDNISKEIPYILQNLDPDKDLYNKIKIIKMETEPKIEKENKQTVIIDNTAETSNEKNDPDLAKDKVTTSPLEIKAADKEKTAN